MKKKELQAMYPKNVIYTNWADVPANLYTETQLKKLKVVKSTNGLEFSALFASRV